MAKKQKESANKQAASNQSVSVQSVLWNTTWLAMQSPMHKYLFVNDLEWLIVPPVRLSQFRMWHKEDRPIGYVSWASLNNESLARVKQGHVKLQPGEWNSGENIVVIDVIAPFGGGDNFIKELKEKVFKDKKLHVITQSKQGRGMEVVEFN